MLRIYIITGFRRKLLILLVLLVIWAVMLAATIFSKAKTSVRVSDEFIYFVFESENFGFSLEHPASIAFSEQKYLSSEIVYHVDFKDNTTKMNGFIQVWDIPEKLEAFLEKSLELSEIEFKTFEQLKLNIGGNEGVVWEYEAEGHGAGPYMGKEYFIESDNYIFRLSFFSKSKQWDSANLQKVQGILDSFIIYKENSRIAAGKTAQIHNLAFITPRIPCLAYLPSMIYK